MSSFSTEIEARLRQVHSYQRTRRSHFLRSRHIRRTSNSLLQICPTPRTIVIFPALRVAHLQFYLRMNLALCSEKVKFDVLSERWTPIFRKKRLATHPGVFVDLPRELLDKFLWFEMFSRSVGAVACEIYMSRTQGVKKKRMLAGTICFHIRLVFCAERGWKNRAILDRKAETSNWRKNFYETTKAEWSEWVRFHESQRDANRHRASMFLKVTQAQYESVSKSV